MNNSNNLKDFTQWQIETSKKIEPKSELDQLIDFVHSIGLSSEQCAEIELKLESIAAEIENDQYLKGFDEGKEEGVHEAREEIDPIIDSLNNILKAIEKSDLKNEVYSDLQKINLYLAEIGLKQ